jgi:tRNA U55 pseudouridine synthase TruB
MSIAAGIALIVVGAILTFAVKGGHIGDLDLHAVGVILMLAGVIGIMLPRLLRNRSRFYRPTIRSRRDVVDDETQTVVEHSDGSQTVEHNDSEQIFTEPIAAEPSLNNGRQTRDGGPRH